MSTTTPSVRTFLEQKVGELPLLLIYAFLEWVMIALLFVDGMLAFISNEFAKIFDLRIPCLLCTRIDHVLVRRDPSFYYNESICEDHKKNISSLAYCHVHRKLSDIRTMCQACLLSFATGKDSDCCEKYKSLVGILHGDAVEEEQNLVVRSYAWWCSCCGEPLKVKVPKKKSFMRNLSMNRLVVSSSPRASRLATGSKNEEGRLVELPHIRCKEANPSFDTASEINEYDGNTLENRGARDVKATLIPFGVPDMDETGEGLIRTPSFSRGNRFFGVSSDAVLHQSSPRWANRLPTKPTDDDKPDGDLLSRLKRQLHLDQNTLMALQQELDEERSAAAVAANNAMAMITRLQAEKAAVQMEALQYQRMMEEQAEYDEEALQYLRDMVMKREEDIKALEAEVGTYREKYGPVDKAGSEICEVDIEDDCRDMRSQSLSDGDSSNDDDDNSNEDDGTSDGPNEEPIQSSKRGKKQESSSLDFEGERTYLLGLLTGLEKKMLADEGILPSEDPDDEGTENNSKAVLREVSIIKDRLKAIEAESGFLKHAAMTLRKGDEGTKLLSEIAQHLRDRNQPGTPPSEETDA